MTVYGTKNTTLGKENKTREEINNGERLAAAQDSK
jgi:hypothetical protein